MATSSPPPAAVAQAPLTIQEAAQAKVKAAGSTPLSRVPEFMTNLSDKGLGQIAHAAGMLTSVITAGFAGALGPLIVFLMVRSSRGKGRAISAIALNTQIVVTAAVWLTAPMGGFGDFVQGVMILAGLIAHGFAILRARTGEVWSPPRLPSVVR